MMGLGAYFIGIVVSINLGMAVVCLNKRNNSTLLNTTDLMEINCSLNGNQSELVEQDTCALFKVKLQKTTAV